ncbi:MAG: glycosyltransferase family 4 protein [Candidatus Hydrogenedentes bacterium]|nr:glycosyltransferase family 4 protein [Candidatus Hydrogenedentota bacterium]
MSLGPESNAPAASLRLLILCAGAPESERAFSGSARSLFTALERLGCVHHKANVLGITDSFQRGPLPLRVLRRLDRFGLEERYRWSNVCFARNSRRARRIARAHPGFNACLMYGTTFLPRLDVPTYCYFDATFAQVFGARAWGFAHFSEAHARAIYFYQKRVYDHCTGIFPRTHWAADSVAQDFEVPREKIHVAGAGPNYFAGPLPHAPYDNQTILYVGADFERKGGPLLVRAFQRVRARFPRARLIIIGCTPVIDVPGVEVVGKISKDAPGGLDRLLQYYSEAAVFCIMSHFEPFGIVVLEAQNSFVPCVAPARFAFPETIQEGVTGRLVPEYDPEILAQVLCELLANPERLREMGQAAHQFVRGEWTWDVAARRIVTRIQQDLQRGPQ